MEYYKDMKSQVDDNELLNALKPKRNYTKEMIFAGATPLLVGFLTGGIGDAAGIAAQGIDQVRKEEREDEKAAQKTLTDALKEKMKARDSQSSKLQQTTLHIGGKPVAGFADPSSGKYYYQGKEVINPIRGFKPDIRIDPKTDELTMISSTGEAKPIAPTYGLTRRQQDVANEVQRKMLLDKTFANSRQAFDAADKSMALLAAKNPIADSGSQTVFARMFGEVGNLAVAEQARFSGSPSILQTFERLFTKAKEGTLAESDRNDLMEVASIIAEYSRRNMDQVKRGYIQSEKPLGRLDDKSLDMVLSPLIPQYKPTGKIIEEARKKAQSLPEATKLINGKVFKKNKDGLWEAQD